MSFDPDKFIKELAKTKPKVLFYPSSGCRIKGIFDMPYDVFIFADYYPPNADERRAFFKELRNSEPRVTLYRSTVRTRIFRVGDKWGFLFFQDNKEVFKRISNAGLKISCFVGVNDGCGEGGNYECVNDLNWLEKVFASFPKGRGKYITDHSRYLYPLPNLWNAPPTPEPYPEFILKKWHFKRIFLMERVRYDPLILFAKISSFDELEYYASRRYPFEPSYSEYLVVYDVSPHNYETWEWTSKTNVILTLEHDNIAHHIDELDGIIVSKRCLYLIETINNKAVTNVEVCYGWKYNTSIYFTKRILEIAKENKWNIVGTTAYGNRKHEEILSVLNDWREEYPKIVRIFYLDSDDFDDVKGKFKRRE